MRALRPALFFSCMAGLAFGSTIVVDDDGGTPDLATALASASAGDTVLVLPGTYVGSFSVPEEVSLIGSGPAQTILDGDSADWTVGLARGSVVRGFTITGGENGVEATGGAAIRGNLIIGNGPAGSGAGIRMLSCGMEVSRNVISQNHALISGGGLWVVGFPAMSCQAGDEPARIFNNLIAGNLAPQGAGLYVRDFDDPAWRQRWPSISQNTIVGNVADAEGGAAYFFSDYTVYDLPTPTGHLTNNVIAGNTGGGVRNYIYFGDSFYSYGPPTSYNLLHDNGEPELQSPDTAIGLDGNLQSDPQFLDAASGDYRLQPGSPAIDAGAVLPDPAALDLDGYPRPVDGDLDGTALPDRGAFEETGTVSGLTLAGDRVSLAWSGRSDAATYNLYRGVLSVLLAGGPYTQDPGTSGQPTRARQWCDLAVPAAVDDEALLPEEVFFYLATPAGAAEGGLGFDSSLQPRDNANPC